MRLHKLICTVLVAIMVAGVFAPLPKTKIRATQTIEEAASEELFDEEGVTEFVVRLYDICVGRAADEYGLSYWTRQLRDGKATGVSVAYGFIFSQEFQSKGYGNDEYVEIMYSAFFGRPSDAAGKANWIAAMDSGMNREELFVGFANSVEFFRSEEHTSELQSQ